jgi:hypothetical protein
MNPATLIGRWALPAVLVAGAVAIGVAAAMSIAFDWEIYVGEALNSYFADHLISHGELYREWTPLSPYFPIYPPGFYAINAPFQLLDPEALWQGRLLSAVGFAAAAFASWRVARMIGCEAPEALVSALGFLLISVTGILVAIARPDGIAIGLIGCAIWAATSWEESRRRRDLWIAAALSAAFVVVKYNFAPVAAGIAVAVWLRDRKAGYSYGIGAALLTAGTFGLVQLVSGGLFGENTSDFAAGYSLGLLRSIVESIALPLPNLFFIVAAVELVIVLVRREQVRVVHLGFVGAVAVLLSAAKVGASVNYVAPAALLASMLAGPALTRLRAEASPRWALAVPLLLAVAFLPSAVDRIRGLPAVDENFDEMHAASLEAAERLTAVPGPVFGDRNDLTIAANKGPSFDNLPMTILADDGVWDTEPLIQQVNEQELDLIQSGFDLSGEPPESGGTESWPKDLVMAVRGSYCVAWSAEVPASTGNGIWLYEPCDPDER